jgi:hypothetical protein
LRLGDYLRHFNDIRIFGIRFVTVPHRNYGGLSRPWTGMGDWRNLSEARARRRQKQNPKNSVHDLDGEERCYQKLTGGSICFRFHKGGGSGSPSTILNVLARIGPTQFCGRSHLDAGTSIRSFSPWGPDSL